MNLTCVRFEIGEHLRRSEFLFIPLMQLNKRIQHLEGIPLVTPDTELVIEGFFRCANTFAALAFVSAQPKKVKIANHTHAPASIIRAAKRGIPTLVLIRNPVDTVVSLVLKHRGVTLGQGLKGYACFYKRIWPYREGFIVADFPAVTSDFGSVIEMVNARFKTEFAGFEHSEENQRQILNRILAIDSQKDPGNELTVSIPREAKELVKKRLTEQLEAPTYQVLLEQAFEIYTRYANLTSFITKQ